MAVERERVQRELPVRLTQTELLELGDKMSGIEIEIGRRKEDRKALNAQIHELSDERRKIAVLIDSGEETRLVRCTWIEDLAQNCKRLIRQDTGIEVDVQALTADDRQEAMFGETPASDDAPSGAERIDLDDVPDDDDDPEGDDEDEQQPTASQLHA